MSPLQAKKAAATKAAEQAVAAAAAEAMDVDDIYDVDDEAEGSEAEAEAARRGRTFSPSGGGEVARDMTMSPELSADTPSLFLDGGGGMGLTAAREPAPI